MNTLHSISGITARIFQLPSREPFMLAADLADVYGTSVKALNQAVSRNPERFPEDFMFSLTEEETDSLRSQNVTANTISSKVRYAPQVFTHAGAYALSAVLKTPIAAEVSVVIHRAFAAMEKRALDETLFLLTKLRSDAGRTKAIRQMVIDGVRAGLDFEAIWRMGNYPRQRLAQAMRECWVLGLIDTLPAGTPAMQMDMFAHA